MQVSLTDHLKSCSVIVLMEWEAKGVGAITKGKDQCGIIPMSLNGTQPLQHQGNLSNGSDVVIWRGTTTVEANGNGDHLPPQHVGSVLTLRLSIALFPLSHPRIPPPVQPLDIRVREAKVCLPRRAKDLLGLI